MCQISCVNNFAILRKYTVPPNKMLKLCQNFYILGGIKALASNDANVLTWSINRPFQAKYFKELTKLWWDRFFYAMLQTVAYFRNRKIRTKC